MEAREPLSNDAIDALNLHCYNAHPDLWDRLPFADFLPAAIMHYGGDARGRSALEVGAGTGLLAQWLKGQGYAVLCLDPAAAMVQRCRARGLAALQTTLQEYRCRASYDLVSAVLSLIHVPKREAAEQLQRIAGWLKPGGLFVMALIEGEGEGVGDGGAAAPRYFAYYRRAEVLSLTRRDFECLFERHVKGGVNYMVFIFKKRGAP